MDALYWYLPSPALSTVPCRDLSDLSMVGISHALPDNSGSLIDPQACNKFSCQPAFNRLWRWWWVATHAYLHAVLVLICARQAPGLEEAGSRDLGQLRHPCPDIVTLLIVVLQIACYSLATIPVMSWSICTYWSAPLHLFHAHT